MITLKWSFVLAISLGLCDGAFSQDQAASKRRDSSPQLLDRVVAVVNEEVLTLGELNLRVSTVSKQLQKQGTPLPPRADLTRQMLERMVYNTLQLQYAKQIGLRIDDSQVDRALQAMARENNMSLPEFRNVVKSEGMTFERFREDIRSEITVARLREREVESRILVSEADVDSQLEQDAKRPAGDEELLVAHILLRIPEQASSDDIEKRRQRAEAALTELKKGADFGEVSASYSDAQEALQGGALGWRTANRLPTLYTDALTNLQKGQLSAVLRSGNGFHIVKLVDRRGAGAPQTVTQTRARHILVRINDSVSASEARQKINQIKRRIDDGADFAEVAKTSSDDATASKGGDLGWVYPGDTVPEFQRAMDALDPGKVGEPLETPFGWHIIQVQERKTAEVSSERNRAAARLAIRQRKADENYQEWLRQLRDRAYVEYRLDERL